MEKIKLYIAIIGNFFNKNKYYKKNITLIIIAILLCIVFINLRANNQNVINIPEVAVQKVTKKTLPLEIKVPSSFIANESISIRSRIDGQIKQIHFKEGQLVHEGDLLFTIDDDLLKAQLAQTKANIAKNEAQLEQAKKVLIRNKMLLEKKIITKSAIDQYEASVKTAQGSLDADKAQADWLELQIGYAKIKAPITGIVGFIKIEKGSFVRQSADSTLVSITNIETIEAIFEIPEKYLTNVLKKGIENLIVKIFDVTGKVLNNACKPLALDQGVDTKAGVFLLKVAIENKDMHLRPGMSITGTIQLGEFENAITISPKALLSAQDGNYVFVYNATNKKVRRQLVKIIDTVNDNVIIENGLAEGQMVVTAGQIHIKDQTAVKIIS
jgi:multidrug efflux system membrane fusion protein